MMRFETILFVLTVFPCSANAALRAAQIPALAPPENAVQLVAENGPLYLHRDGVLELRGSRGWLRTKGVYLDFKLSFEYRPMTADADTGIVVRSWGGVGAWPQAGYRLRLPRSSDEDASKMLTGRRRDVTVLEQGRIDFNPGDAWQRVVVEASGQRVAVRVNDAPATVYEIESYGGHVFFDTGRGRTEIRNLLLFDTEPPMTVPEGTLKVEEDDAPAQAAEARARGEAVVHERGGGGHGAGNGDPRSRRSAGRRARGHRRSETASSRARSFGGRRGARVALPSGHGGRETRDDGGGGEDVVLAEVRWAA
jgi:hypothetical protein